MSKAERLSHKYLTLRGMSKSKSNIHKRTCSTQEGFLHLYSEHCHQPFVTGPAARQGLLKLEGHWLEQWASSFCYWTGTVGPGHCRLALGRTPALFSTHLFRTNKPPMGKESRTLPNSFWVQNRKNLQENLEWPY